MSEKDIIEHNIDNTNKLADVKDDSLTEMGDLCNELITQKDLVKTTEDILKKEKENLNRLQNEIANKLKDRNLYSLKLMDGSTISWKEKIRSNIKAEDMDAAYAYIRHRGAGDLIKNEVSFSFGRGQDDDARKVSDMFRSEGYEPSEKVSIPWNTLDAWVRDELERSAEEGRTFPEELFGVFRTNNVTIKS